MSDELEAGELHVWSIALDAEPADGDDEVLYEDERVRASRFHFERHRRRFIAGRVALRRILARYLTREPAALRFEYAERGKPGLRDGDGLEFNLSHSSERGLLVVGCDGDLGIDLELVRPLERLDDLAERSFSERECRAVLSMNEPDRTRGFYDVWTRKEACVKLAGDGLARPLSSFDVPTSKVTADAEVDLGDIGAVYVSSLDVEEGYTAALATRIRGARIKRRDHAAAD